MPLFTEKSVKVTGEGNCGAVEAGRFIPPKSYVLPVCPDAKGKP
jgi:hypothetical protein